MATPPQRLVRLLARPSELTMRVGFNGIAQIVPIVVTIAITPLLLDRLGLDQFGIWSLGLIILNTLTALDGGVAASLARFFAMYAARDARVETGRLLLGSLLFFTVLGLGVTAVAYPLAPAVVPLLHVPTQFRHEATFVLRWLPPLATLALMADSTVALLQGNGQFRALAVAMSVSSGTFVIAVVVLVQPGTQLRALIIATALRYVVLMATSLAFAARHISIGRPPLPSRSTIRELMRYASRMQLSAVTGFVNGEMDALVIAAVLPIRYVGLYSVGMQAASAARSLPLYAFAPLLTRLTATFRNEGRRAAATDFWRLEMTWLPVVLGYGVVAVAAIGFSIPLWLGDRYVLSGVVAAILLSGFVVHVGFTGMRTCYVRAVGRPGLEARYSVVWTIGNAAFTIPLAILVGVVGVVTTTAVTGAVASVYFVVLCRKTEGLAVVVPGRRWAVMATAAAGLTILGELLVMRTNLHGFLALGLSDIPPATAWFILATGLREAPAKPDFRPGGHNPTLRRSA